MRLGYVNTERPSSLNVHTANSGIINADNPVSGLAAYSINRKVGLGEISLVD